MNARDPVVMARLDELLDLYQYRWGKPVDYVGISLC